MSSRPDLVRRIEQLRAAMNAELDALLDEVRGDGVREEKKRSRQVQPKRPAIEPNDLEQRMAQNILRRTR